MAIPKKMELYRSRRRFVKIGSDGRSVWAIADDGTAWRKWVELDDTGWVQIPPLPDDVRFDEVGGD